MNHSAEFRRCLEELDVGQARKLWRHAQPHLYQPANDHEMLIVLHRGRVECEAITERQRAYSHRWLLDRGYPSSLPDALKPRAERLYPRKVEMVGIAVRMSSPELAPVGVAMRQAMEAVVLDAYSGSKAVDPVRLRQHMLGERARTKQLLLGTVRLPQVKTQ